jgi:hypothetical protein
MGFFNKIELPGSDKPIFLHTFVATNFITKSRTPMKRVLFFITIFISFWANAQVPLFVEPFKNVPLENGKVVFRRELKLNSANEEANFEALRVWARDNYGKDPFISSVRYDRKNMLITAKSRIELLLPLNSKNIREKIVMRYRIDVNLVGKQCTVVFREISFLYENPMKTTILPKISKAEAIISDQAITIQDEREELRANIRKSTLYFINQTCHELYSELLGK